MNTKEELIHWVTERTRIRALKERGDPKPWTTDPILRDYKFCNVRREDDKVSRWIQDNWLYPNAEDNANIAFAMCVARHFNWPDTLQVIKYPHEWNPEAVRSELKAYRAAGNKVYTGAYLVSTCGRSMDKIDYSIDVVLNPLRAGLRAPQYGDTLESYWKHLREFDGFASFMAGQVVADLKLIQPLRSAVDWWAWAPLGPGSVRGLNRYHARPLGYNVPQAQGLEELRQIQEMLRHATGTFLPLHNVQNCMCEFDKYLRLKYDGGKVRSKYNGAKE